MNISQKDLLDAVSNNRCEEIIKLGPEVIPELINFFLIDDPRIHNTVSSMLASFGKDAVQPLIAALESPHVQIRRKSVASLGDIVTHICRKPLSMPEAVEPLILRLQDGDSSVQMAAAWALLRIHKTTDVSKAIPALVALLSNDDANVRDRAVAVLSCFDKVAIPQIFVGIMDMSIVYEDAPFSALKEMNIKDEKFKKIICEQDVDYAIVLGLAETHQVIDSYYKEIEERGDRQEIRAYRQLFSKFYRYVVRRKNEQAQPLALSEGLRLAIIKPPKHEIYRIQRRVARCR